MINLNQNIEVRTAAQTITAPVQEFIDWISNEPNRMNSVTEWIERFGKGKKLYEIEEFDHKELEILLDAHIIIK